MSAVSFHQIFMFAARNRRKVSRRTVMQSGNDLSHRRRLCVYTSDVRNHLGGKSLPPALTRRNLFSRSRFHTRPCAKRNARSHDERRLDRPAPFIRFLYTRRSHHRSFVVRSAEQFRPWPLRESCASFARHVARSCSMRSWLMLASMLIIRVVPRRIFCSFRNGNVAGYFFLYRNR